MCAGYSVYGCCSGYFLGVAGYTPIYMCERATYMWLRILYVCELLRICVRLNTLYICVCGLRNLVTELAAEMCGWAQAFADGQEFWKWHRHSRDGIVAAPAC